MRQLIIPMTDLYYVTAWSLSAYSVSIVKNPEIIKQAVRLVVHNIHDKDYDINYKVWYRFMWVKALGTFSWILERDVCAQVN